MDTARQLILDGRYELLRQVKAGFGDRRVELGQPGRCRFCGCTDGARFRKAAHTFPEALGNKWVFSLDECDDCNARFSRYEDALAKGVSPFLTLGGIRGKANRVRQTGRSEGRATLSHSDGEERRHLSVTVNDGDPSRYVQIDSVTGIMTLNFPIAGVPFVPRLAYKALWKIAYALLPEEELPHFTRIRSWLLDVDAQGDVPRFEVGASFGSIGNAPAVVAGCLLRRCHAEAPLPYLLFLFCAGSICLQIALPSDALDEHVPAELQRAPAIRWATVLAPPGVTPVRIDYGEPTLFDWSTPQSSPQPVESVVLHFDPVTTHGQLTPVFRQAD